MTTTFEKARVGDKVWHIEYGWGTIEKVDKYRHDYPLTVRFYNGNYYFYKYLTSSGKINTASECQTLFWDEVKIEAPQMPRRMVEKGFEQVVWVNEDWTRISMMPPLDMKWEKVTLKYETEVEEE